MVNAPLSIKELLDKLIGYCQLGGNKMKNKTKKLTFLGLMIALVFIATFSIRIPIPFTQGYIHAGDSMIFITAILFGWQFGALAGGIGSAIADLVAGYTIWIVPTLIIKAIMGAIIGLIVSDINKPKTRKRKAITYILTSGVWFGFSYLLRFALNNAVTNKPQQLIDNIDTITNIDELLILSNKLQNGLLALSLIIPVIILILSVYLFSADKKIFSAHEIIGMIIAGLWMVLGYYLAAGLIYNSFIVPIFSIPWNIIQFVGGLIIAYFILIALKKTSIDKYIN